MKKQIENPYKLNWLLYIFLLILSIVLISSNLFIKNSTIASILRDIGLGCIASTIVAFVIDFGNIKEKNRRFNELYESTYMELQFGILRYLQLWSDFCYIAEGSNRYKSESKKWSEWYKLSKELYSSATEKNKKELQHFLIESLLTYALNDVNRSIQLINSQKNLLQINNIYDRSLDSIIKDFEFEFKCAMEEVKRFKNMDDFWRMYDALNLDFTKYIDAWEDISFYNELNISPYWNISVNDYINAIKKTKEKKKEC